MVANEVQSLKWVFLHEVTLREGIVLQLLWDLLCAEFLVIFPPNTKTVHAKKSGTVQVPGVAQGQHVYLAPCWSRQDSTASGPWWSPHAVRLRSLGMCKFLWAQWYLLEYFCYGTFFFSHYTVSLFVEVSRCTALCKFLGISFTQLFACLTFFQISFYFSDLHWLSDFSSVTGLANVPTGDSSSRLTQFCFLKNILLQRICISVMMYWFKNRFIQKLFVS